MTEADGGNIILGPGPEGWWDSERVSSPQVLRLADGSWRIWYYGRHAAFDREVNLPAGRSGMARSADGIHWERVRGPLTMGAVLEPGPAGRFDSHHVGITEVHQIDGLLWCWFLGGDDTVVWRGDVMRKGLQMRVGCAVSRDGVHWTRMDGPYRGAVLDAGAEGKWDALFAGWPAVFRRPDGLFVLHYHTLDPQNRVFTIGLATSDDGLRWEKRGPVLAAGPAGSFDERGGSCRDVVAIDGGYVMFYEGVALGGNVSIGLATSDDGLAWQRTGTVVLEHGAARTWDSHAVGIPCLVPMPDGGWRMYYVGANDTGRDDELSRRHAIGLAVSEGGDYRRWTKFWR